jgi:hypothetical protein
MNVDVDNEIEEERRDESSTAPPSTKQENLHSITNETTIEPKLSPSSTSTTITKNNN